jgi:uncharacterized membrane protein
MPGDQEEIHEEKMDSTASQPTIRSVDSGRGVNWLTEAWDLFKRNPGIWIAIIVIWIVLSIVVGVMPLVGSIATNLFAPVISGGLMMACKRLDEGGDIGVEAMFEGFKGPAFSKLVILGLLSMAGGLVIAFLVGGSLIAAFGSVVMMGGSHNIGVPVLGMAGLMGLLVALLLVVPLSMALWFAPALVALRGVEPVEAVKLSFAGCLSNIMPMLVYSVLMLVMLCVASIPLLLGLLVALPVVIASIYCSYKDIYA